MSSHPIDAAEYRELFCVTSRVREPKNHREDLTWGWMIQYRATTGPPQPKR